MIYIENATIKIDLLTSLPFTLCASHNSSINKMKLTCNYNSNIEKISEFEYPQLPEHHKFNVLVSYDDDSSVFDENSNKSLNSDCDEQDEEISSYD